MKRDHVDQPAGDEEQGTTPEQKRTGQHASRKGMTRREMLGVLGALGASVGGTAWMMSGDKEEKGKEKKDSKTETKSGAAPEKKEASGDLYSKEAQESEHAKQSNEKHETEEQRKKEARDRRTARASKRETIQLDNERNEIWEFAREAATQPGLVITVTKVLKAASLLGTNMLRKFPAQAALRDAHDEPDATRDTVTTAVQDELVILRNWQDKITQGEVPATAIIAALASAARIYQIWASRNSGTGDNVAATLGNVAGDAGIVALVLWRLKKQSGHDGIATVARGTTPDDSKSGGLRQCSVALRSFERNLTREANKLKRDLPA